MIWIHKKSSFLNALTMLDLSSSLSKKTQFSSSQNNLINNDPLTCLRLCSKISKNLRNRLHMFLFTFTFASSLNLFTNTNKSLNTHDCLQLMSQLCLSWLRYSSYKEDAIKSLKITQTLLFLTNVSSNLCGKAEITQKKLTFTKN